MRPARPTWGDLLQDAVQEFLVFNFPLAGPSRCWRSPRECGECSLGCLCVQLSGGCPSAECGGACRCAAAQFPLHTEVNGGQVEAPSTARQHQR